jgi:hypothetical protein
MVICRSAIIGPWPPRIELRDKPAQSNVVLFLPADSCEYFVMGEIFEIQLSVEEAKAKPYDVHDYHKLTVLHATDCVQAY